MAEQTTSTRSLRSPMSDPRSLGQQHNRGAIFASDAICTRREGNNSFSPSLILKQCTRVRRRATSLKYLASPHASCSFCPRLSLFATSYAFYVFQVCYFGHAIRCAVRTVWRRRRSLRQRPPLLPTSPIPNRHLFSSPATQWNLRLRKAPTRAGSGGFIPDCESESANLLCVIPEHDFFGSSNLRVPWLRLGAFSAIPSDLGNDTDRPCRPYLKTIHLTKPVPHTNNPAKHIPTYPTTSISIRSGASRENGST